MFGDWFEVFFKPHTIKKHSGDFGKGVLNIFVASLIYGVIMGLAVAFLSTLLGAFFGGAGALIGGATGIAAFFLILIYAVISGVLGLIIGSAILLLFAKIFGGEGGYSEQTFAISLPSSALMLVAWIPVVNFIAALYYLYPLTIVLRETHNYSTGKAVLTWLIPMIIALVLSSVASLVGILATAPTMRLA